MPYLKIPACWGLLNTPCSSMRSDASDRWCHIIHSDMFVSWSNNPSITVDQCIPKYTVTFKGKYITAGKHRNGCGSHLSGLLFQIFFLVTKSKKWGLILNVNKLYKFTPFLISGCCPLTLLVMLSCQICSKCGSKKYLFSCHDRINPIPL